MKYIYECEFFSEPKCKKCMLSEHGHCIALGQRPRCPEDGSRSDCPLQPYNPPGKKALTLDELQGKHGKPVYVVCEEFPELNGWYIVHLDKQTGRIECWGYDSIKMDSATYGEWLAYLVEVQTTRRKCAFQGLSAVQIINHN